MIGLHVSDSNGCWVEVFAARKFRGAVHRLYGPADFPMLRVRENGWGDQIQSLRIGPSAYVQCFEHLNFDESVFWMLPNEVVDDVAGLHSAAKVNSLRLWDRPPFAHEPGYAAYMLWAASKVAKHKAVAMAR